MSHKKMIKPALEPLEISCSNADCENDLHCFLRSKRETRFSPGQCQACGADLIDWPRVHRRDPADVENTLASLKKEWIRHEYWHRDFDQRAINYARRKGRLRLHEALEHRLRKCIAIKSPVDGRQTPWEGNPLYYAQHAIACCCRKCLEYWHGVPVDQPLTEQEIQYFIALCDRYLKERLPNLPDHGVKVPPLRSKLPIKRSKEDSDIGPSK